MHILKEGERVSVDLRGVICEFMNDDRASVELDDGRVIVLHIGDIHVQPDGGVCTCKNPVPTTSTQNLCGNCGKPRRRAAKGGAG